MSLPFKRGGSNAEFGVQERNDKTVALLLQLYLVRARDGHESGPSEDEVAEDVRNHLANTGFDPTNDAAKCLRLLGKDWAWALGDQLG